MLIMIKFANLKFVFCAWRKLLYIVCVTRVIFGVYYTRQNNFKYFISNLLFSDTISIEDTFEIDRGKIVKLTYIFVISIMIPLYLS